ncbi:Signal peptide-containing protein OS=Rhodopirellula sallentina SM41 GN=RSSM_04036 PE=4 SV=1 [Gemmata massiliana]|uniref:Signal peptide-containing protein n=1 Tax=Gemmata massiliana TaxID=1210884 RepID=A0A6P2D516_9BACT|nr:hypothetical protein [Gemmata massiliana]VTR94562.1 Signal peptide-containing protein OS=Rhodopirellula sallentina SM41 GN=RSSM_04036 PE=4 SV=1 [Gemmata massiliana]
MLKKMVILAVVGFVAVIALKGTKAVSLLKSEWHAATKEAEDSIPPEKEIARLKHEVTLLDKDIRTLVNHLAKERVEVVALKDKVDDMVAKQSRDKEILSVRADAIKKAEGQVVFGERKISVAAAKSELEEGVKRYGNNQKSLDAHESLLSNRIKGRDALEKQLEAMKNQKSELTNQIEAMETDLAVLKLQQMESKYQTDDSRLAKIKEDMQKLKMRVEVEREKLKLLPAALDESPATSSNGSKSVDDIMAPLNAPAKKPETKTDSKLPIVD